MTRPTRRLSLRLRLLFQLFLLVFVSTAGGPVSAQSFALRGPEGLVPVGVALEATTHRGEPAVRVTGAAGFEGHQIALLPGARIADGVIELWLAGQPTAGANDAARGFVGVAFRVAGQGERFECFYLRPTNGRAEDQLRRNHAAQYVSHPGFPWHDLRKNAPGVYESYVDLVPGDWTNLRIEVTGAKARLFVHGATQPALIVNDLKLGESAGGVALWIGEGTEAWFRDLKISPAVSASGGGG